MGGMIGADVEQLNSAAAEFSRSGAELHKIAGTITGGLHSSPWYGPGADRYRHVWDSLDRKALIAAGDTLKEIARQLSAEANAQVNASSGGAGGGTGSGPSRGFRFPSLMELALATLAVAPAASWILSKMDKINSIMPAMDQIKKFHDLNAARKLKGLPALSLTKIVKLSGPLSQRIPVVGTALTVLDVALNWHQYGIKSEKTQEAIVSGSGEMIATAVAGPAGGLAFYGGWQIGKFATDHTQVDEWVGNKWFDTAYGDSKTDIQVRSAEWWRNASPADIQAEHQRDAAAVAEANRIAQRASNPLTFALDLTVGNIKHHPLVTTVNFLTKANPWR